ncbi:MAG TPA: hypothetical protein VI456_06500 [Polyangia bacterium]
MVPEPSFPSPASLRALARKYARLAAWRDRRDGDGLAATRDDLRALATEFPGCLRELDTLGATELARRAAVCAAAADDAAAAELWMPWIDGYHTLVRRALAARDARARGEPTSGDAFEQAVLSPPGGRMGVVVMRALAERFGAPASTIAAVLFPVRRPSPYAL